MCVSGMRVFLRTASETICTHSVSAMAVAPPTMSPCTEKGAWLKMLGAERPSAAAAEAPVLSTPSVRAAPRALRVQRHKRGVVQLLRVCVQRTRGRCLCCGGGDVSAPEPSRCAAPPHCAGREGLWCNEGLLRQRKHTRWYKL